MQQSKVPKRNGFPWTDTERDTLFALMKSGKNRNECALELQRKPSALNTEMTRARRRLHTDTLLVQKLAAQEKEEKATSERPRTLVKHSGGAKGIKLPFVSILMQDGEYEITQ